MSSTTRSASSRRDVEGRELGLIDRRFLRHKSILSGSFGLNYPNVGRKVDDALALAIWKRVQKVTPILQTHIVEVKNADGTSKWIFSRRDDPVDVDPADAPFSFQLHRGDYSDPEVNDLAFEYASKEYEKVSKLDYTTLRKTPLKIHIVLGPQRVACGFTMPHCFLDGTAISAIIAKSMLYFFFPRPLWFIVDQMSPKNVPLMEEMVLKKDLDRVLAKAKPRKTPQALHSASREMDEEKFWFNNFNLLWPGAYKKLRGCWHKYPTIPHEVVQSCREGLRAEGASMSTAFTALTVKTLAVLLDKFDRNPFDRYLTTTTPVDGRGLGTWGDERDKQWYKLPVCASYVFDSICRVPYQTALKGSIGEIAQLIKADIKRIQTDPIYRAECMDREEFPAVFCGASSIFVPRGMVNLVAGRSNEARSAGGMRFKAGFGALPHCFFYVFTCEGLFTEIAIDINLPIQKLDQEGALEAVRTAAAGSPLEALFQVAPKTGKSEEEQIEILSLAPPPWHTLAVVVGLAAVLVGVLPSLESLDQVADVDAFTRVRFPNVLDIRQVAMIRLGLGLVMVLSILYTFLKGKWEQSTVYFPGSQLHDVEDVRFRGVLQSGSVLSGLKTISPLTMWNIMILAIAFVLMGGIPLYVIGLNEEPPRWIMRMSMICWEVSAPTSLLISVAEKYIYWPYALANFSKAKLIEGSSAPIAHNWTTFSCLVEVTLLGGLPVRLSHLSFALLFGVCYALFSYTMMHSWTEARYGPQVIYPFLDTTLGWGSTLCLLALLGVLTVSFAIFCWLHHLLTSTIVPQVVAVIALGAVVCRFGN